MTGRLDPNWFAEGPDDVEFRQYVFLSWLQDVQKQFAKTHLYPALSDLVFHYGNLLSFKEVREKFNENLRKDLKEVDLKNLKLNYEQTENETEEIERINEVVEFAIPRVKKELDEGKEMYEFIEKQIEIEPIGLMPLYKSEGYLLVAPYGNNEVRAYKYQIGLIVDPTGNYRQITTEYVHSFTQGFTTRFEHMKMNLIKVFPALPNPATFAVVVDLSFPEKETLLPIVKRKFMRHFLSEKE